MQYHILMVEDDPKIREAIIDYFSEKAPDYLMDTAKTGQEGLDKIEENNYDLVLLDVMLPQMSGFDVIVKIRRSMDIPVIFMTARTSEEDRLYGYELGCDDYICKPFSIAELLAKVNALMKRAKGIGQGFVLFPELLHLNPVFVVHLEKRKGEDCGKRINHIASTVLCVFFITAGKCCSELL